MTERLSLWKLALGSLAAAVGVALSALPAHAQG